MDLTRGGIFASIAACLKTHHAHWQKLHAVKVTTTTVHPFAPDATRSTQGLEPDRSWCVGGYRKKSPCADPGPDVDDVCHIRQHCGGVLRLE